jgi:hypothetical protein
MVPVPQITEVERIVEVESVERVQGENTLETSGEDGKLHSKRVDKIENYTRNEWRRC